MINPFLEQRFGKVAQNVPLKLILETPPPKLSNTLGALGKLNVEPIDMIFSQFILVTAPAGLVEQLGKVEDVTVHYNMPRSVISAPLPPIAPPAPLVSLSIMDPLLGEFKVDSVVVPAAKPFAAPPFPPLQQPNYKILPTSLSKAVLMDVKTSLSGRGVLIAVLDTGATPFHPQLISRNVALETVVPELPFDMMGHGMWCTCAAAGSPFDTRFGRVEGMATAADLLHVKTLSTSGMGDTYSILKAMEIAYGRGAKVVSMSLGGDLQGSVMDDPEVKTVEGLSQLGMIFVIAAGNSGPSQYTIGSPGAAPSAITVGSMSLTDAPSPAYFSSRGPQGAWYMSNPDDLKQTQLIYGDNALKPDVLAPGGGRADASSEPDEVIYSGCTGWFDGFYDLLPDTFEGMHGCVVPDTVIHTDQGMKTLEDVQPGDRVYSFDGYGLSPGKVVKVWDEGVKPTYTLRLRNRSITVSAEHRFLTLLHNARGAYAFQWLDPKQLQSLNPHSYAVVNLNKLPSREAEGIGIGLAKWLGYFLGDGWLSGHSVELAESDNHELDAYYNEMTFKLFGLKMRLNQHTYRAYSKHTASYIQSLGLHRYAQEKVVPELVYRLPHHEKMAFIEGYLDADGYRNPRGQWVFECASKKIIQGLMDLMLELGFKVSSAYSRTRTLQPPGSPRPITVQTYSLIAAPSQMNYVATEVIHRYLAPRYIDTGYLGLQQVRGIEESGEQEVKDLTVDAFHNYAGNGILNHNTSQATPQVAGLVALLVEAGIVKKAQDFKDVMALKGNPKDVDNGYGLVRLSFFAE